MLFSKIFSEYSKEAKILLLSALLEVCCVAVNLQCVHKNVASKKS